MEVINWIAVSWYTGVSAVGHLLLLVPHPSGYEFAKGLTSMFIFMFIKSQMHSLARKRKKTNRDGIAVISSIIGDGH